MYFRLLSYFSCRVGYVNILSDSILSGRHAVSQTECNDLGAEGGSSILQCAQTIIMMQSINRFLYGPTPDERVRAWQAKLRGESRQLDREMRQVRDQLCPFQNSKDLFSS